MGDNAVGERHDANYASFSSSLLLTRLELCGTKVYEPYSLCALNQVGDNAVGDRHDANYAGFPARTSFATAIEWATGNFLHRNVQRCRGGLVFKAHRLCVSLNSRLESNKEERREGPRVDPEPTTRASPRARPSPPPSNGPRVHLLLYYFQASS